jgi:hypothetical protein
MDWTLQHYYYYYFFLLIINYYWFIEASPILVPFNSWMWVCALKVTPQANQLACFYIAIHGSLFLAFELRNYWTRLVFLLAHFQLFLFFFGSTSIGPNFVGVLSFVFFVFLFFILKKKSTFFFSIIYFLLLF